MLKRQYQKCLLVQTQYSFIMCHRRQIFAFVTCKTLLLPLGFQKEQTKQNNLFILSRDLHQQVQTPESLFVQ